MTISGDIADANAFEAAMRAARGPDPAPRTLTGAERRFLVEGLEGIVATVERQAVQTKTRHERQRLDAAADTAQRLLDMVKPT